MSLGFVVSFFAAALALPASAQNANGGHAPFTDGPPSGMAGLRDPGACELLFVLMRNGASAGAVSRADFE